jgi:thioredoxin 1
MKPISCLLFLIAAAAAYGQFGGMRDDMPPQFDSSDIIADRIVKSPVPVMIDFWATWCKPCKMLGPTVEELKKKYSGKIKVIKIDVDANRRIAAYFRVSSIPAVFFIKDKAVVQYVPGLQEKSVYEQAIVDVLKPKTQEKSLKDSTASPPAKR